ncbi:hypothetical protein H5968_21720 [Sphaerospermopsis sp. LEGE 00249]|uniref:hypothetical protein n=1 Tax=Sphaerospermopsis sp. LEGE 00249 TaxID=1380707 RepID=UPI00164D52C9|nr:hypothetical protein [Sphaerospermopsis sp. LEGE 00249]MBC5797696.1 hypothetical protein [Sphaerospermopsis sp. LEGE 00249]
MKTTNKNPIFTEITDEEASTVSGGGAIGYLIYMLLAQTPASPGGVILTNEEIHYGWNILINPEPSLNFFTNSFSISRLFSWFF